MDISGDSWRDFPLGKSLQARTKHRRYEYINHGAFCSAVTALRVIFHTRII